MMPIQVAANRRSVSLLRRAFLLHGAATMLAGLVIPATSVAQQGPDFAVIRTTPLQNVDRDTVRRWVDEQIQKLLKVEDDQAAMELGRNFHQRVIDHFTAANAHPQFKQGFSQMVVEVFHARYREAATKDPAPRPLGIVYLLMTINRFADPVACDALILALGDRTPGPRLMAATGLLAIHEQLNDQRRFSAVLAAVRKAGMTESNAVVLSSLYRLLTVQREARAESSLPIVQAILGARLSDVEQKHTLPAMADAEAATWLGSQVIARNNPEMTKAGTWLIGRLLDDAAYFYLDPKLPQVDKERLERIVRMAEKQLKAIARSKVPNNPSPDVTAAMLAAAPNRADPITLEVNKWVGTSQSPGLLNAAPFDLPIGLGIKRAPPATAPSPATPATAPTPGSD